MLSHYAHRYLSVVYNKYTLLINNGIITRNENDITEFPIILYKSFPVNHRNTEHTINRLTLKISLIDEQLGSCTRFINNTYVYTLCI